MGKWFSDCHTIEALKRRYFELAKEHHPDHGGTLEIMQEINAEFDRLAKILRNKHEKAEDFSESKANEKETKQEDFTMFREIIEKLVRFDGIKIEICGSWIWLTKNTYPYRKEISELGFRWSKTKKAWYYTDGLSKFKYRATKTLNQIRKDYGATVVNTTPDLQLN